MRRNCGKLSFRAIPASHQTDGVGECYGSDFHRFNYTIFPRTYSREGASYDKKPKRAQSAQGHPRLSLPRRHDNWYIRDYLPLANCHFRVFLAEFNLHFRDLAWYKCSIRAIWQYSHSDHGATSSPLRARQRPRHSLPRCRRGSQSLAVPDKVSYYVVRQRAICRARIVQLLFEQSEEFGKNLRLRQVEA